MRDQPTEVLPCKQNDGLSGLGIAASFEIAQDWTQPQCLFRGRHKEISACATTECCVVTAEAAEGSGLS